MKKIIIYALYFVPFLMVSQVTNITDSDILNKINNNDKPFVIDFYATWCAPCRTMAPILDEFAKEYKDRIDFYRMDIDSNEADDVLGITSIPTFYFVKNGEILFEEVGSQSKEDFKISLETLLEVNVQELYESQEFSDSTSTEYSDNKIQEIWNEWTSLNNLAWHGYEKHDEPQILLKCIKMIVRSIELDENYQNLDTYASLLYKMNDYTNALKQAKRAIELAIEMDLDYSSTTLLVNQIIAKL